MEVILAGLEIQAGLEMLAAEARRTAAKEAEKRSQAMYQSTEELLKFQFMSMSLSYFSSLNMLSNLRDINADTTNRAVASVMPGGETEAKGMRPGDRVVLDDRTSLLGDVLGARALLECVAR